MRIYPMVLAGLMVVSAGGRAQVVGGVGPVAPETYTGPLGGEGHPVRVSSGVMAGLLRHRVMPVYPPLDRNSKVGGATVIAIKIDPTGKVVESKLISGPETLRSASLEAVRQWTFKPYLLNGEPVYVQTTVTLNILFGGSG